MKGRVAKKKFENTGNTIVESFKIQVTSTFWVE